MMNCTTNGHVWVWTSVSSSTGIPDHVPCQCGAYAYGEWHSIRRENARLRERVAALEAALRNVRNVLGPAACACEGQQVEVDIALKHVRAALAGEGQA